MTYKKRHELLTTLRELTELIEEHGLELPEATVVACSSTVARFNSKTYEDRTEAERKRDVQRIARALAPIEKKYLGETFLLKKKLTHITVSFNVSRDVVCRAVKTGKQKVIEGFYSPSRIVDEVEWVCDDPLLAPIDSQLNDDDLAVIGNGE